jgi:hypothetical protein
MANVQTVREALVAELIGDVDTLLQRVEALRTTLPETGEAVAVQVKAAGMQAASDITGVSERLKADLARQAETLRHNLYAVTSEAHAAAQLVDGTARRFGRFALLAGFGGGILGGVLAGLALAAVVFEG